ncbi:polyprotein [Fusarium sacchari alphavirus-like virus 1]|uniref:Polyprotein n=1 Tax=Fusarium sacchari alphavirus-like virus 1 TaxID=2716762 RepID=A0A6G9IWS2_9VIRU|nr:polyprotein [Fusarium sacchari alphavirus-like virus 1]
MLCWGIAVYTAFRSIIFTPPVTQSEKSFAIIEHFLNLFIITYYYFNTTTPWYYLLPALVQNVKLLLAGFDGFCYLAYSPTLFSWLGAFPTREELLSAGYDFSVRPVSNGLWHTYDKGISIQSECVTRVGSASAFANFADACRDVSRMGRRGYERASALPPTTQLYTQTNKLVNNVTSELPISFRSVSLPKSGAGTHDIQEHRLSHSLLKPMDKISALESARYLLSGLDSIGTAGERLEILADTLSHGIPTSLKPSDPNFAALVKLLGPLKYSPRLEAHPASATIRRAAMNHAILALQGSVVALVSPSRAELHAFPNAVVWQYTDGLDASRIYRACTMCKNPICSEYERLRATGRLIKTNSWQRAAAHFRKFECNAILLMNIEPNIDGRDLCALMVKSNIFHGYSLATVDWRALLGPIAHDNLIGMTTEQAFGKIVSSFHDSGDYVQSISRVRQLFAPTYAEGAALRRTTIFSEQASHYMELSISNNGWASRCVPSHDKYYFIKVVMPDLTRPVIVVERQGFDRVLATYRTQALKDKDTARIVLRQSVVTYSISGTQVTPRIKLSHSQAEALAIWMVVYSEVQDSIAVLTEEQMRPKGALSNVTRTVFDNVATTLKAAAPGVLAVSSVSSIDAILRMYRSDFGSMSLEQLSNAALEEHFGTKLDPLSLQSALISKWKSVFSHITNPVAWFKSIGKLVKSSWSTGFTYVDLVVVMTTMGMRFSLESAGVVVDALAACARITGQLEVVPQIQKFQEYLNWQIDKSARFWVSVQDSQDLDFQAACIDIVETFFNVFSTDHAVAIQAIREKELIPEDQIEELELNAALPYSDFLSELKLFLSKFNTKARRLSMTYMLLNAFYHDKRHVSQSCKSMLIHLLKEEVEVKEEASLELAWALTGTAPETKLIPVKPVDGQDVRLAFDQGTILLPSPNGAVTLNRLDSVNGSVDFSKIHNLMDMQHGDTVRPENLKGPNYISPDAKGADIQQKLIAYAALQGEGASFARAENVARWYQEALATPTIPYVDRVLRNTAALFNQESQRNWIAHMTGLACGGKSKGFESWVTADDLIVVPTDALKRDWQANLGKLDPVRRATVVTQHAALEVKYAARYVIIDECYAYDPEHLQAIANRQHRSKGIVTIGDKRQIANVFSPTGLTLRLDDVPCIMITPTTFVPWDAAVVYLTTTSSDVHVDQLFCGSNSTEGLVYTLTSDDVLMPGENDIALQGTQAGKEIMNARGITCNTTHECQGRRSNSTVYHALGNALVGDLKWLSLAEQRAHAGVTITRARQRTIFVVDEVRTLAKLPWFDDTIINGPLPSTLIYGGTSWDLVEPRTESESTWEHLYEDPITETSLQEVPLTDPITIATVFTSDGDPISSNEICANVELVSGVTFTDENLRVADTFDNYTIQPRDVPGADQIQALTRAMPDIKPTPDDYLNAERIVELLFEEVIDKKLFFAHINNSRRAALHRQTRQQVIDGCYANTENRASTYSYAFLKPEFSKKPSIMPGELKAQGVVAASDMQQAIFADCCDALTHAWARAMQPGKLSPVGLREEEVEGFLATFDRSFELDIEKQDSSHKPVHIIVASIFIEMCADHLGLGDIAMEIRNERTVRMMATQFKFVLNKSLGSGDPWTLIINKIMAWSSLISVAVVKDCRACQSGDDITLDRVPDWRKTSLKDQLMANVGVTWKDEEREQRRNGVTFISRAVLSNGQVVYKAMRTILKYAFRKRNQIQHAGIQADVKRILKLSSKHGLQAYCEARAQVWGGDPVVIFDMWVRAIAIAQTPFDDLPESLKSEEPRHYTIKSRNGGCFGYALANCVETNVQAINALAAFHGPVNLSTAIRACRENKVSYLILNERFANRSRKRLQDMMDRRKFSRAFVVLYEDHAVAVVPNTITLRGAFGKRTITWKFSDSKDVIISDFD